MIHELNLAIFFLFFSDLCGYFDLLSTNNVSCLEVTNGLCRPIVRTGTWQGPLFGHDMVVGMARAQAHRVGPLDTPKFKFLLINFFWLYKR